MDVYDLIGLKILIDATVPVTVSDSQNVYYSVLIQLLLDSFERVLIVSVNLKLCVIRT